MRLTTTRDYGTFVFTACLVRMLRVARKDSPRTDQTRISIFSYSEFFPDIRDHRLLSGTVFGCKRSQLEISSALEEVWNRICVEYPIHRTLENGQRSVILLDTREKSVCRLHTVLKIEARFHTVTRKPIGIFRHGTVLQSVP